MDHRPARSGATLADVLVSAAAAVGGRPEADDVLGLGEARHAVVLLIDGLGARLLARHPDDAPFLTEAARQGPGPIATVFPSTTATALGSLGTGAPPGAHGIVGSSFLLPETGQVLAPLQWGEDPHPLGVQPRATVFELAARSGVRVATVGPAAYARSGLTRAALRGGQYLPADDLASRVAAVRGACDSREPSLTYAYWPELDRIGHGSGVASADWRAALRRADGLASAIAGAMGPDSTLIVTADHGMVDVTERIALEADPRLTAGVRCIAGEPRVRHVYAAGGDVAGTAGRWREALGDRATILTRDEVADRGLLGPLDEDIADRVGDLVAIAADGVALASTVDPTVSGLIGQHGALTEDEMLVPAIVVRA